MPCSPTIARGVAATYAIAKETVCWGEPAAAGTARSRGPGGGLLHLEGAWRLAPKP